MKITILTHLEKENAKTYDAVVDQVADVLRQGRHKVSILGIHGDMAKLRTGLARRKPDLVFNLMETFGASQLGAVGLAGLLDLLGLPYTGGGPGEIYIQEDKVLTKKLLAFDGIRYPEYALFSPDADLETGGHLRMPLFVKPLRMDASIGIDARSLVRSTSEMMERVLDIHRRVKDSALVEEYVEGREFYIGVLGNQMPQAFPPIEMDFSGLPDGALRVLDAKAKWDEKSPQYKGTLRRGGRPARRTAGASAKGRARRLPRPARARLRTHRPASDRGRRGVRHRGQCKLLPRTVRRVRHRRASGRDRISRSHPSHRRISRRKAQTSQDPLILPGCTSLGIGFAFYPLRGL